MKPHRAPRDFKSVISDPVRYHHESPTRIAQALPMTQIVYIANFLCQDAEAKINEGIALAQKILGFSSSECNEFIEKSGLKAKDVALALGIGISIDESAIKLIDEKDRKIQDVLVQDVRNVSLLTVTLEGFLTAKDKNDFLTVISNGLKILVDIDRFIYFLLDAKKGVLFGYVQDVNGRYTKNHSLAVPMSLEHSLLVKVILGKTPLNSFKEGDRSFLPIIDEQIIGLLGGQGLYCLPIAAQGDSIGVLVLSIQKSDLPYLSRNEKLLKILIHKGALALQLDHLRQKQLHEVQVKRAEASSDLARRVVHEVNNPLSIIKNYLKILEIKLSEGNSALDEIGIINEEISRVAQVLKKLTDFSKEKPETQEMTDVNALLKDIVKLTKNSLLEHSRIKLVTNLEKALPKVNVDKAGLKQVILNLIKNAGTVIRPGNNFFNSSVSIIDPATNTPEIFTLRTPNSSNTLGFDAGIINIPNPGNSLIPNGATSASISLGSNLDIYYYYFSAFAIEIIAPNIVLTKIVEDELGNDIGGQTIGLDQPLNYVIGFQNTGNDDATNFQIRDVLPINIVFNYPTDLVLPAGVTVASYNPTTREIIFDIEDYLVEENDPVYEIRIEVRTVEFCSG